MARGHARDWVAAGYTVGASNPGVVGKAGTDVRPQGFTFVRDPVGALHLGSRVKGTGAEG